MRVFTIWARRVALRTLSPAWRLGVKPTWSVFTKSTNIKAWEQDIDATYTEDQWQKALQITFTTTKSANLWEVTHKILRWYLTPYRISKFDPQTSPLCWRNCGQIGTLHHVLWKCPGLQSIWSKVFYLISKFIGSQITPNAAVAVLSLGIEYILPETRTIVTHILLSTRLVIMRHWKEANPPTFKEVVESTNSHATYELMFAAAQGNYQKMRAKWSSWYTWYTTKYKGWI